MPRAVPRQTDIWRGLSADGREKGVFGFKFTKLKAKHSFGGLCNTDLSCCSTVCPGLSSDRPAFGVASGERPGKRDRFIFSRMFEMRNFLKLLFIMVQIVFVRFKEKTLDRHTGASPENQSRHRFEEFRSDLSSFHSFINPLNYAKLPWFKCLS